MTPSRAPNRRADARRSRAAILDAAVELLTARPDAGLEAVATAAGVTRQTVYAHFRSRQELLAAVVDRVTGEVVAAMDAADPATGPAAEALLRLLDASARAAGRYRALLPQLAALPASPDADRARHAPIADRLGQVIRRGQRTGDIDDRLPPDWLVAVVINLAHAASAEVDAGRLSGPTEAAQVLRTTVRRVLDPATPVETRSPEPPPQP